MPLFDRCNNCHELKILHNGLCDDCASHISATTPGGNIFGSSFGSRPDCQECGGTGWTSHFFGSPTKCSTCKGTGKQ